MRVLHVTSPTLVVGGGDTILQNLLSEKIEAVKEEVITTYYSPYFMEMMQKIGIEVRTIRKISITAENSTKKNEMKRILTNLFFIAKFSKMIEESKPDIIQAHGFTAGFMVYLATRYKNKGIRKIYTHHDIKLSANSNKFEEIVLSKMYNSYDICVAVSEIVEESLKKAFPKAKEKFTHVHNCVNWKFFVGGLTQKGNVNSNNGKKYFVEAARFFERKRQLEVIDAVFRLPPNIRKDIKVIFCGEGPTLESAKNKVKEYGIEDSIEFLGVVPSDKIPSIMRACDYGLFPCDIEGFGLGAVECMSCGLPVLAQKNPLMEEVIGKTGILVEIENLTDGFIEMLKYGEDKRELAYNRALQFTPKIVKNNYLQIFKGLLNQ